MIKVKLLGAVALIDEGETDWKVLAIDVEDPLAAEIDDIAGLEAKMPGEPSFLHGISARYSFDLFSLNLEKLFQQLWLKCLVSR